MNVFKILNVIFYHSRIVITLVGSMNLREFILEHLTCISDDSISTKNQIFILSDNYDFQKQEDSENSTKFMNYTPKNFRNEFMARKHLILIYQGPVIVLGMTMFEYAYVPFVSSDVCNLRWSRSYIQYIDSTGLYEARQNQSHLTKSLIRTYMLYCARELKMESLHLLATAKPAFLFAGSEFIEQKRALPAVKLVNWWLGVVEQVCAKDLTDAQVFIYSPFEEASGSNKLSKRISKHPKWKYGVPYDSKAPCIEHVPFFEDDPKWRHFEASILDDDEVIEAVERTSRKTPRILDSEDEDDCYKKKPQKKSSSSELCKMTIKEFFSSLQVRPEFRDEMSAFVVIRFQSSLFDPPAKVEVPIEKKSDLATFGCKLLSTLTFEGPVEAKKSSQKITSWMKLMAVPGQQIKTIEKQSPIEQTDENIPPPAQVNSLQSLIKRKLVQ